MSESEIASNKGLAFSSVVTAGATYQSFSRLLKRTCSSHLSTLRHSLLSDRLGSSSALRPSTPRSIWTCSISTQRNWLNSYLPNFVVKQNRSKVGSRRRGFANWNQTGKELCQRHARPSVICISEQRAPASKVCYRE